MYNLRRVIAFLAAVLTVSLGGAAHAQTLPTSAGVTLNKSGIVHSAPRSNNRGLTLINRADCDADDIISFPVSLAGRGTAALQAWVGTQDCTQVGIRQTVSQTQCWKVYDAFPGGNNPNTPTLDISLRAMLAGFSCTSINNSSGTAGASSTGGDTSSDTGGGGSSGSSTTGGGGSTSTVTDSTCPIYPINQLVVPDANLCARAASIPVAGATNLTIYFMLVDPSTQNVVGGTANWPATFKLVGPPAPDQFSAGIGGNLLVLNFSYSATPADQTGAGFNLYCDPPQGRDVAVDAGLLDPDASTGTTTKCGAPVSEVLISNQLPPTTGNYQCGGTSSPTAQSANATNLVNGVAYNVAVAAVDSYGNTGPLSALKCAVPQEIDGFYKAYKDAGGQAGGGFCSFSRHREPLTLIAVLGFASYLVLRRRRAA